MESWVNTRHDILTLFMMLFPQKQTPKTTGGTFLNRFLVKLLVAICLVILVAPVSGGAHVIFTITS